MSFGPEDLRGFQSAGERRQLLYCLADPTSRRLVDGLAVQLDLEPIPFEAGEIDDAARFDRAEMLVVDEPVARRLAESNRIEQMRREGVHFALVAALPAPDGLNPAKREAEPAFDGLLSLAQAPALVMAQLSVILYAHRTYVQRYDSALEELNLNRRIFRSVTSGISIADATREDFPLVYVNPAFEVMTGYALEEIAGTNCRFLQRGDHNQPGLTLVREALRGERETLAVLRNYRKDGTPFWNELSLSPIRDRSGRVTHFVGIQSDVSARIAFEDALRESEKLAAVGRLAASIAHEINNPLESITNLVYLARRESHESQRTNYLAQAEDELKRVSQLTAQSLRFYKQSSRAQAVRPTDLITAVLDVYAAKMLNFGVRLERRDTMCESIVCLESEIRQVLSNLVRNALDAMSKTGGRLLVRTHETTDGKTMRRGVAITVADTGSGMSQETISKLYTAFYTTKGIGGTGLGLWVSAEIVQRHGGRLSVRSRQGEGCGTVFRLFLPFQAASPLASSG